MKFLLFPAVFLCWLSGVAAPFQNLGFDEAVTNITELLPPDSFRMGVGYGPASDLLPGWQVFRGGTATPVEKVGLNIALGLDIVSIYDVPENSFFDGPYCFGTVAPFTIFPERSQYSLVQRGDIPADANWISFKRDGDPVEVSINGTPLPLLEFSAIPGQPFAGTIGVGDVINFDQSSHNLKEGCCRNRRPKPVCFGPGCDAKPYSPTFSL